MNDIKLFLGIAAEEDLQKQLQKANPYLRNMMIGKEDYLQQIHLGGKSYLGKYLLPFPTLSQIEDLEKHILSILKALIPAYSFSNNFLILLPMHGN